MLQLKVLPAQRDQQWQSLCQKRSVLLTVFSCKALGVFPALGHFSLLLWRLLWCLYQEHIRPVVTIAMRGQSLDKSGGCNRVREHLGADTIAKEEWWHTRYFLSSLCFFLAKVNSHKDIKLIFVSLEATSLFSQFTEYRWHAVLQMATNVQAWKKHGLAIAF